MDEEATKRNSQLEMIAGKAFPANNALVEVVDFLNKSLKKEGYVFGVSKTGDKMTIMIYQTEKASRSIEVSG